MRRSLRVLLTTTGGAALLLASARAHADTQGTPNQPPETLPPVEPPPAPPPTPAAQAQPVPTYGQYQQRRHREKSHWYGWQNLIVDGGVVVGGLVLVGASGEAGGVVLVTGYFFGGPIVHWSHGQVGRGFASLGVRVGAPLLLAGLGYAVFRRDGRDDLRGAAGAVLGFGLGVLGAIAIDAAVLAYEKVDADDDDDARAASRRRNGAPSDHVDPVGRAAHRGRRHDRRVGHAIEAAPDPW